MCYDAVSATRTLIRYAKHRGDDPELIAALEKKLEQLIDNSIQKNYYVSGFAHPKLLCFTNDNPNEPRALFWGLIPSWVKDEESAKKIANQTLNARIETIFEKPAFRNSAKSKRCVVYLDAFYEHHHKGGKTFPYRVYSANEEILSIAGLWDEWINPNTGEIVGTVSIVTTQANELMTFIHNNPKAEEARMPLLLRREDQDKWLMPIVSDEDKKKILNLAKPLPNDFIKAHTVRRLKGKEALGNVAEAEKEFFYPELNELL